MRISSARFEISAAAAKQFPAPGPAEVVFVGRSNVGKSSLLNTLTRMKGLAKVSASPGKTRLINFFLVNESVRFVDLPGYGFAQASRVEREGWKKLVEIYFTCGRPIRLVIVLIDARHPLQDPDARMVAWLARLGLPMQIVLTKIDKLSRAERARQTRLLGSALAAVGQAGFLLQTSAVTGEGRLDLLRLVGEASAGSRP